MKFFFLIIFYFITRIYSFSLWEARLAEQKAKTVAEGPHSIVHSPDEAPTAPKVVVTQTGRVFVVRGADEERKRQSSLLEELAMRRTGRIIMKKFGIINTK